MNKTLIAIVLSILLAGGGLYYYTTVRNDSASDNSSQNSNTLRGLLSSVGAGESLECTFSSADAGDGKVYVAGNRVRGDFNVTDDEGDTSSMSMIVDGDYGYYWGSEMVGGLKMEFDWETLADVSSDSNAGEYNLSQAFDLDMNSEVDYNCGPWRVDASVFTPPSDVTFTDVSEQLMIVEEALDESTPSSMCATCDQLTGEAQAMCRQTLCN